MGNGPRYPRARIEALADRLLGPIRPLVVLGGSLRRGSPTCGDVDVVVPRAEDLPTVHARLLDEGCVVSTVGTPRSEYRIRVPWSPLPISVDVWTAAEGAVGALTMHATGPGVYNTIMRRWALAHGLRLSWNGVWRGEERIAGATEAECCAALGWPDPPPEHRARYREWIDPYLDILEDLPSRAD